MSTPTSRVNAFNVDVRFKRQVTPLLRASRASYFIPAKHWTREQAIANMAGQTGMAESAVVSEIERYIVNPGQACAY